MAHILCVTSVLGAGLRAGCGGPSGPGRGGVMLRHKWPCFHSFHELVNTLFNPSLPLKGPSRAPQGPLKGPSRAPQGPLKGKGYNGRKRTGMRWGCEGAW